MIHKLYNKHKHTHNDNIDDDDDDDPVFGDVLGKFKSFDILSQINYFRAS
jgi:hypothetical protein